MRVLLAILISFISMQSLAQSEMDRLFHCYFKATVVNELTNKPFIGIPVTLTTTSSTATMTQYTDSLGSFVFDSLIRTNYNIFIKVDDYTSLTIKINKSLFFIDTTFSIEQGNPNMIIRGYKEYKAPPIISRSSPNSGFFPVSIRGARAKSIYETQTQRADTSYNNNCPPPQPMPYHIPNTSGNQLNNNIDSNIKLCKYWRHKCYLSLPYGTIEQSNRHINWEIKYRVDSINLVESYIHGYLKDYKTGKPITGKIKLLHKDILINIVESDSLGYFSFRRPSMKYHYYNIMVEAEGYESCMSDYYGFGKDYQSIFTFSLETLESTQNHSEPVATLSGSSFQDSDIDTSFIIIDSTVNYTVYYKEYVVPVSSLSNVIVTIESSDTIYSTLTDTNGNYSINISKPGLYKITFSKKGFYDSGGGYLLITSEHTQPFDAKLNVAMSKKISYPKRNWLKFKSLFKRKKRKY